MNHKTVTIYHTNDIHNQGRVLSYFSHVKKDESTLILDAGDALKGSNTLFYLNEPILKEMSLAGYDAMTMGNREFNYIRKVIEIRKNQVSFPILCANIIDLKDKVNHCFTKYMIKDVNGMKIGIFGLTVVQYPDNSLWLPVFKFRFLDPLKTSETIISELRDKVDILILLSHLGINRDKEIAAQTEGIDFIVGGHSHTLLEVPLRVNNTRIIQAGSHGKYVGKLTMTCSSGIFNPDSDVQYEIITL
jgi:2',3'-cyclic-nucleotide 2'-phosphodiesterase (5'-nucleotidase family)